jgi:Zn-dependent alcohol dehydrogenase
MVDDRRGQCRFCNWSKFNWCSDGKRVNNQGNCHDWKPDKLSDAAKKKQAVVMMAAHKIDVAARNAKKDIIRKKRGKK